MNQEIFCRDCEKRYSCDNLGKITKYTECKSYKEYLQVEESKFKRREGLFCGELPYYDIDSDAKIEEVLSSVDKTSNLAAMIEELNKYKGRLVSDSYSGYQGILTGIEICPDDYYYIIIDDNGERHYITGYIEIKCDC